MALVLKDRVRVISTTTGTGTFTLGSASAGFQDFSVIGDGNTTYYAIQNSGDNTWEVGIGTYTASGTTLSRDTILESSNGGTAVNFAAGTKDVFVTYPAEKGIYLDASGNSIGLGTPASATLTNATGLPIATGVSGLGSGIATFLTTPSSANLATAVTDETGSGSLVFATSPTLTTPVLGTPSSGTLTSCTGLPLTTGVTGTLPVANGGTGTTSTTFVNLTTNVTGTLPVANGGTGITSLGTGVATFLGTPSSANLASAVTDETGTGSLVFATSPTLVTPALGTPSSGTVTNLTGTASININGTVGATTPTTGAFTTLSSSGATTFTAGTASTSTTTGTAVITGGLGVSGRINAANFDGIVGANTAAAGSFTTLSATGVTTVQAGTALLPAITTSGDTNTGIWFPAADTIAASTAGTERMRIDSSGNLQFNSGYGSAATAYGCRAWVNFNGSANTNLSGTYARTSPSTTLTVTATAHGLIAGNSVNLDFTTGTGVDGIYTVVTVADANTFTVTTVASTTTSGNVTLLRNTINGSGNVSSITDNGTGDYTVNFITEMPDGNYSFSVTGTGQVRTGSAQTSISSNIRVITYNDVGALADSNPTAVAIFR
jgi:hypothetical protein